MSFEQIFTRIDKILWRDDGSDNELDYAQQASWFLFLKYLDDIEAVQNEAAKLDGKKYEYILVFYTGIKKIINSAILLGTKVFIILIYPKSLLWSRQQEVVFRFFLTKPGSP